MWWVVNQQGDSVVGSSQQGDSVVGSNQQGDSVVGIYSKPTRDSVVAGVVNQQGDSVHDGLGSKPTRRTGQVKKKPVLSGAAMNFRKVYK